jgi:FkbM family methyltransferase
MRKDAEMIASRLARETTFSAYLEAFPFSLVDVGAAGGIVREWGALEPHTRVVAVEPNSDELERIKPSHSEVDSRIRKVRSFLRKLIYGPRSQNIHYFNSLLGETTRGEAAFYLFDHVPNSSVYAPNVEVLRRFGKAESWSVSKCVHLPEDTLDGQLANHRIEDVDFIKLDTQGSELSILKGGEGALGKASGVFLEVEFLSLYENQPLFGDVDVYLRSHGFDLVEIVRTKYWKAPFEGRFLKSRGQIVYGDVLYLKKPKLIVTELEESGFEFARSKVIKAAALSALYAHPDHGFEIVRAARDSSLFTTAEVSKLEALYEKSKLFRISVLDRLPNIPGKAALGRLCCTIYHHFVSRDRRWTNGAMWK